MNRNLTILLALASIFFLFGSLVTAEEADMTAVTTATTLTAKEIAAMKEKQAMEEKEKLMEKYDARIRELKSLQVVRADIAIRAATIVSVDADEVNEKVTAEMEKRRGEEIHKFQEWREKHATFLEDLWASKEMKGDAQLIERLRLAVAGAENAELSIAADLKVLYDEYKGKTTPLTTADKKKINDKIREFQKLHLTASAKRVISAAETVDAKLTSIIARLDVKMDALDATIPGAKQRLVNVREKLLRVQEHLQKRIAAAKDAQAAYAVTDEGGNTTRLRHELHLLTEWTRISGHAVLRFIAMVNHINNAKKPTDEVVDTYDADIPTLAQADVVADAAVADEWLSDEPIPADTVTIAADADVAVSDDVADTPDDSDNSGSDDETHGGDE